MPIAPKAPIKVDIKKAIAPWKTSPLPAPGAYTAIEMPIVQAAKAAHCFPDGNADFKNTGANNTHHKLPEPTNNAPSVPLETRRA